jgi:hypothetical protein
MTTHSVQLYCQYSLKSGMCATVCFYMCWARSKRLAHKAKMRALLTEGGMELTARSGLNLGATPMFPMCLHA